MSLRMALPKGRLQEDTRSLLERAGYPLPDYHLKSRSYLPVAPGHPELTFKVFHEKDIAIQVATGSYDLGICALDWVEELLCKYPSSALLKVRELGFGKRGLYAAASGLSEVHSLREVVRGSDSAPVRIVTEYPNLAEAFALRLRLKRFQVFPVWGRAEVYPPENAELAILAAASEDEVIAQHLRPLASLMTSQAVLVANKESFEGRDLSAVILAVGRALG